MFRFLPADGRLHTAVAARASENGPAAAVHCATGGAGPRPAALGAQLQQGQVGGESVAASAALRAQLGVARRKPATSREADSRAPGFARWLRGLQRAA